MKDRSVLEPPVYDFGPVDPPQPLERLLRGYAGGTLDPCMHALVEGHLILSKENRSFVRALENKAGAELDEIEPAQMSRSSRDHVLGAIYAGGWYGRPRPPKIDPAMPDPIAKLVGAPLDALPWRFATFGVRQHVVSQTGDVTAVLLKVAPGRTLPSHTHTGLEATLVLKGGFTDHSGHHVRGDISVADDDVDHRPVADLDGLCVCFAVTEGALKLTGPIGKLLQKAFGG